VCLGWDFEWEERLCKHEKCPVGKISLWRVKSATRLLFTHLSSPPLFSSHTHTHPSLRLCSIMKMTPYLLEKRYKKNKLQNQEWRGDWVRRCWGCWRMIFTAGWMELTFWTWCFSENKDNNKEKRAIKIKEERRTQRSPMRGSRGRSGSIARAKNAQMISSKRTKVFSTTKKHPEPIFQNPSKHIF